MRKSLVTTACLVINSFSCQAIESIGIELDSTAAQVAYDDMGFNVEVTLEIPNSYIYNRKIRDRLHEDRSHWVSYIRDSFTDLGVTYTLLGKHGCAWSIVEDRDGSTLTHRFEEGRVPARKEWNRLKKLHKIK